MLYVKDIMTREVKIVSMNATILQCARLMSRSKIGSLVVMPDSEPVGIVTEGDISRAVADSLDPSTSISKIKSSRLVTISPDAKVEEAAKLMSKHGIKKLPVVEGAKLVGIVTQTDIVSVSFSLVTTLKEMINARYTPPGFEP